MNGEGRAYTKEGMFLTLAGNMKAGAEIVLEGLNFYTEKINDAVSGFEIDDTALVIAALRTIENIVLAPFPEKDKKFNLEQAKSLQQAFSTATVYGARKGKLDKEEVLRKAGIEEGGALQWRGSPRGMSFAMQY